MPSTISGALPPFPGLSGNIINGTISLDFPNNINISYTTLQTQRMQRQDVGGDFTYKIIPLTVQSIVNKVDLVKQTIYSTIQIGMKEFNVADPVIRKEYEKLEKQLKDFSKAQLDVIVTLQQPIILSVEKRYNAPRPEYTLAPTLLTYGQSNNTQDIPGDNIELINDPETAAKPPQSGVISDFGMNYDMSGPTKTLEISTYSQGIMKKQQVIIYGYAYSTSDPGVVTALGDGRPYYGASLEQFWRPVERYTITYNYREDLYAGYVKKGSKYTRFAQEQDLEIYESDNDDIKSLYRFFNLPINEVELLSFGDLPDYGDGIPKCITKDVYDAETGKMKTIVVRNPDYKPALYVKNKAMYSRCFSKRSVPPDAPIASGIENQMISTGQENKLIEKTDIISDTGNPVTSTYRVYRYQESSQDADFKNNLKISGSEMFLGLPPQASYINTKEAISERDIKKYVVSANVSSANKSDIGSVNYPECKSIGCAFDKFKEDEDYNYVSEMRGNETTLVMLGYYEAYPGNVVIANEYRGILRSISYSFECIDPTKTKIYTNMVLVDEVAVLPSDLLKLTNVTNNINNECSSGVFTGSMEEFMKEFLALPGRN
jgi:hypothetical protein